MLSAKALVLPTLTDEERYTRVYVRSPRIYVTI